jgi:hypothetical protein
MSPRWRSPTQVPCSPHATWEHTKYTSKLLLRTLLILEATIAGQLNVSSLIDGAAITIDSPHFSRFIINLWDFPVNLGRAQFSVLNMTTGIINAFVEQTGPLTKTSQHMLIANCKSAICRTATTQYSEYSTFPYYNNSVLRVVVTPGVSFRDGWTPTMQDVDVIHFSLNITFSGNKRLFIIY